MSGFRATLILAVGLTAGLGAAVVGSGAATQPAIVRGPSAGTASGKAEIDDLVARINRHRRAIGAEKVTWDGRLARVAQRHSEDMARRGFFNHVNPDGLDPFERLGKAGIKYRLAGENLAAGQRTGEETFEAWMNSPGHRDNLELHAYNRIGIGLYKGRWTCVLMRPATSSAEHYSFRVTTSVRD